MTMMMSDDYVIDDTVVSPILCSSHSNTLHEEGILPTTLGELKTAAGDLVRPLVEFFSNCRMLEADCDDFEYVGPVIHAKTSVLRGLDRYRAIFEEDYSLVEVGSGPNKFDFYYDIEGRILKRISHGLSDGHPTVTQHLYQYNGDEMVGIVKENTQDDVPHVAFIAFYNGIEGVLSEQRIWKQSWAREFPEERHDIDAHLIECTFGWDDYRNRECMRICPTPDPDTFIYTLHRSFVDKRLAVGGVLRHYTITNSRVVQKTFCNYRAGVEMNSISDGVIERPAQPPTTVTYGYDADGVLEEVVWGNGRRRKYERVLDGNGDLRRLMCVNIDQSGHEERRDMLYVKAAA